MGFAVAERLGQQLMISQMRAEYGTYGSYKGEALSFTRQSLKGSGEIRAKVQAFRTNGYDIDHKIPILCGWMRGITPAVIGSLSNLQALKASENRAIGAKGC